MSNFTLEEKNQINNTYQKICDLLDEIIEMQRIIAAKQINILEKLRKVYATGFVKIEDDLLIRHVVQYRPSRCKKCGVLVEGAYEYLRSARDKTLCVGCDGSKSIKEERSLTAKSRRQI